MSATFERIRIIIIVVIFLIISFSCSNNLIEPQDIPEENNIANNLSITEINVGSVNTSAKYRMITFDIKWNYSWRSGYPDNWDAAWVFIKYKVGSGEWKHAT